MKKDHEQPFVVTPEEWRAWRRAVRQNYLLLALISFLAGLGAASALFLR
jgi:hypothetical protein